MANNVAKGVPIAGAVVDVLANIKEIADSDRCNKKFEEQKQTMKDSINELFNEVENRLKSNDYYFSTTLWSIIHKFSDP